jgi:hypothetical protein
MLLTISAALPVASPAFMFTQTWDRNVIPPLIRDLEPSSLFLPARFAWLSRDSNLVV